MLHRAVTTLAFVTDKTYRYCNVPNAKLGHTSHSWDHACDSLAVFKQGVTRSLTSGPELDTGFEQKSAQVPVVMNQVVINNDEIDTPPPSPWAADLAEMGLRIGASALAALWAYSQGLATVGLWAGPLIASYVIFHLLRDKAIPSLELTRQLTLTALWVVAIIMSAPATPVVAVAACAWSTLCARQRALRTGTALANARSARAKAETAFLRAAEEIRRLRIDIKTTADLRNQLTSALGESNSELNLVRSKADALATTLQQVMPFEPESGLLNPEKFDTVLQREWLRMQRQELPMTMVLMKLDNFEQFETAHGRVLYESIVQRVAELLRKAGTRPGDIAARLSVDLFALLFPETEERHALLLAEEVRVRLDQLHIRNRLAPQNVLSASLGVATIVPHTEAAPETLRERAEAALYEASFQGGNRCVRNRIAGFARMERWNSEQYGQVTLASLSHKLAISGYAGKPRKLEPNTPRERRVSIDSVEAVVAGMLKVTLDGEVRTLHPGDCLYLPKGVTAKEEVIGTRPVVCIEAVKA